MADRSIRGRFVWNELMTPDTAGAHEFYSTALGWKSENWDLDPSYRLFVGPNGPLGGSVAAPNSPPQWLPYIGVEDVPAAIEQATDLGASVMKELTGMPNGGTYAILADPQGGKFGVYASSGQPGEDRAPDRGEFSWYELAADDYRTAFDFYSSLFGWERIAEHDMGPLGVYFIFGRNGQQKGGMFNKPPEMSGKPMWCGYVRVKDVNQAVKKVKGSRGALVNGPMEVPGGDWIAQFTDPYGALFAVHTAAADVKKRSPAPPREEEQGAMPSPTTDVVPRPKGSRKAAKKAAAEEPRESAELDELEESEEPASAAAVRPRKTARKVARKSTRKAAKKAAKKAAGKTAARSAGTASKKSKAAKKSSRKSARKSAGKTAKKAAKKGGRKAAAKNKSARKRSVSRSAAAQRRSPSKKAGKKGAKRVAKKSARRKK